MESGRELAGRPEESPAGEQLGSSHSLGYERRPIIRSHYYRWAVELAAIGAVLLLTGIVLIVWAIPSGFQWLALALRVGAPIAAVGGGLIAGAAGLWRRGRRADTFARAFADGQYLVRWTYSPDIWRSWVRRELGSSHRILGTLSLLSMATLLAILGWLAVRTRSGPYLSGPEFGIALVGGVLSGVLALAFAFFWILRAGHYRNWMGHKPYHCYISRSAVCLPGGGFIFLADRKLDSVSFVDASRGAGGVGYIELRFRVDAQPSHFTVRKVMVPLGAELVAEKVVAALKQKGN